LGSTDTEVKNKLSQIISKKILSGARKMNIIESIEEKESETK
jgi:hypothetical protein